MPEKIKQLLKHEIKIKPITVVLKSINQQLFCDPGIYHIKQELYNELAKYCSVICRISRVKSTRYHVGSQVDEMSDHKLLYRSCGTSMAVKAAMNIAYESIEQVQEKSAVYINKWMVYQFLWDVEHSNIETHIGEDVNHWQQFLADVWKKRSIFDTSEQRVVYNEVVTIEFARLQNKVNIKYDAWHKELLQKFGAKLHQTGTDMFNQIEKARGELEIASVDSGNTAETVAVVTAVQQYNRSKNSWEETMSVFKDSQKLLERQRFQFPSNWLYNEQLEGSWTSFNSILDRRDGQIQEQIAALQMRMVTEESNVEQRTQDQLTEWESSKPVGRNISPEQALNSLSIYEKKLKKLHQSRDQVSKAKQALELDTHQSTEAQDRQYRLDNAINELTDLKAVWVGLQDINKQLDSIREIPWPAVQPRNVRKQLDELVKIMKSDTFPVKLRQYNIYISHAENLKKLQKMNSTIIELKSPKMQQRHWKMLIKQLRLGNVWSTVSERTLGQIWDIDLIKNEKLVREVLITAQGEMALEQFLQQTKDVWSNYMLELIRYQTKCQLIRGWDDLFNKLRDNQNALTAMKLSPYYKVFDDEASQWEDKLNRLSELFDVWIDVQRRWVYLDGIFSGSGAWLDK